MGILLISVTQHILAPVSCILQTQHRLYASSLSSCKCGCEMLLFYRLRNSLSGILQLEAHRADLMRRGFAGAGDFTPSQYAQVCLQIANGRNIRPRGISNSLIFRSAEEQFGEKAIGSMIKENLLYFRPFSGSISLKHCIADLRYKLPSRACVHFHITREPFALENLCQLL